MSIRNKGNSKSIQSKLWIEESLLELMQTERYQEITIQQITDHAGLTRRTFYRNYTSKDDIIKDSFYRIWSEYTSLITQQTDLTLPNISKVFFSLMLRYKDFLTLINRHQLFSIFLSDLDELLPLLCNQIKGNALSLSNESIQYALTFSTGGFMHILIKWLNDSELKTPEKMATIIEDFLMISTY